MNTFIDSNTLNILGSHASTTTPNHNPNGFDTTQRTNPQMAHTEDKPTFFSKIKGRVSNMWRKMKPAICGITSAITVMTGFVKAATGLIKQFQKMRGVLIACG